MDREEVVVDGLHWSASPSYNSLASPATYLQDGDLVRNQIFALVLGPTHDARDISVRCDSDGFCNKDQVVANRSSQISDGAKWRHIDRRGYPIQRQQLPPLCNQVCCCFLPRDNRCHDAVYHTYLSGSDPYSCDLVAAGFIQLIHK